MEKVFIILSNSYERVTGEHGSTVICSVHTSLALANSEMNRMIVSDNKLTEPQPFEDWMQDNKDTFNSYEDAEIMYLNEIHMMQDQLEYHYHIQEWDVTSK